MGRFRRLVEGAFEKIDDLSEKEQARQVAKLTPAEREHYDAWNERTEASRAGATEEQLGHPKLTGKIMQGPAGEALQGITKPPEVPDPIEDQSAWDAQAQAERGIRDEARVRYLPPADSRHPVRITRVMTQGGAQVEEICAHLGSSGLADHPELVYGAARVPDLINPSRMGTDKYVEWDIVHAADRELSPAEPAIALTLESKERYVDRAPGERRPLDEDLALDVLSRSGLGPKDTLGIARDVGFAKTGGDANDSEMPRVMATVRGVHVLVGGGAASSAALHSAMAPDVSKVPWQLAEGPPGGVVVEVLQWDAIAQAVHPVRQRRAPLPSPFPYLPLTPQELLSAYLEIVGISPADCFSAQVTHGRDFDLMGRSSAKWGVKRTGGGPDLPCADGEPRKRMAGGHHVVIAYLDRPPYAAGRGRFDAYMRDELKAELRRNLALREPIPKPEGRLARNVDRAADVVEWVTMDAGVEGRSEPPRYCWPPFRA